VELGIGTGWYDAEHAAYAIPFPPLGARFEMLEEHLEIITGLWRAPVGETFSFEGRHHTVKDSPGLPKPVQQSGPPIVIGGGGKTKTPRLAARFADEFNLPFAPVEYFVKQCGRVRAACEAIEREPKDIVLSAAQVVCCGADESEIARRAKAIGREVAELRENGVAGTPEEVAAKIRTFADAGASRMYLQVLDLDDLDHLALLASEVMPNV
jgi:alkanesulfonate monooxygenase